MMIVGQEVVLLQKLYSCHTNYITKFANDDENLYYIRVISVELLNDLIIFAKLVLIIYALLGKSYDTNFNSCYMIFENFFTSRNTLTT